MTEVKIRIQIWACDDECGCSQVQVIWIGPNLVAGGNAKSMGTIEDGKFYTEFERPTEQEFEALARKHGLPEKEYGERDANKKEIRLWRLYNYWHIAYCKGDSDEKILKDIYSEAIKEHVAELDKQ